MRGEEYVPSVDRLLALLRRNVVELLIVLAAVSGVLDVARGGGPTAPSTTAWVTAPAIALVVLPLLGWRRFPFAAPATVWLVGAGASFVDGRLLVFAIGGTVAGLVSAFLLGNLRDRRQSN